MVNRADYLPESVEAARSVLVELVHLLGAYSDDIVLVGGWVPLLLLPQSRDPHIGSLDIDLALDHRNLDEVAYKSIRALLAERGYRQGREPFAFVRDVPVGDRIIPVEVDMLSGEYEGTGQARRHQRVQGMLLRKARGCDLAFEAPVETTVTASLPEGGDDTVTVRLASIVPFLVMKANALHTRIKEKDAYDIYFCVRNYPGGIPALLDQFGPYMQHALVQEARERIAAKFDSPAAFGPVAVADFEELREPEDRDIIQRDACERISEWLDGLTIAAEGG